MCTEGYKYNKAHVMGYLVISTAIGKNRLNFWKWINSYRTCSYGIDEGTYDIGLGWDIALNNE